MTGISRVITSIIAASSASPALMRIIMNTHLLYLKSGDDNYHDASVVIVGDVLSTMILFIFPISTSSSSIPLTSYIEINRNVRHRLQCNGCYNDSYPGNARDAEDVAMILVMTRMITMVFHPRHHHRCHTMILFILFLMVIVIIVTIRCYDDTRIFFIFITATVLIIILSLLLI